MIAYLFRCLFFLMILFTGLLYTSNFPKRSHYLPRVIATTAFGILVSFSGQHCLAAARSHCSCICCIKPQAFWGNF